MRVTPAMIEGLVGSVFSKRFDDASATPDFHRECWELCCGPDKQVAIAAPRGHAKSSAVTLGYGLSTLLFRERKFMLLISDTETQAAQFLGLFKDQLQDNPEVGDFFDLTRDDKGRVVFQKDSETDIVVTFNDGHKFRIIAKGSEQKLRGLIWNGSRPDIIMIDDAENDELVMNKERREKFRRWFKNALLPCRSDSGIVRMVGTVLHMDSQLERLLPSESDRNTVTEELKQWSKGRSMWKAVRYRAHNKDFSKLLWPEKKTAQQFRDLYEEAAKDGTLDGYSQEYLNYPLDESVSFFKKNDFLEMKQEDKEAPVNYYVTADLAISQTEKADFSVFIVSGVDENRRIFIKDVIRERLDGREIVDTLIRLQRDYTPQAIGIEEMQVSKAIGPFLNEAMIKENTFISLVKLRHGGKDKVLRARSIQARMRANTVKFDKSKDWYPNFEDELLTFPRGRNDDQVDAFAYMGLMLDFLIQAPTAAEEAEELYQDELESSEINFSGRSETTGY